MDIAWDYFARNLPCTVLQAIDLNPLVLQPTALVKQDGKTSLTDIVYQVNSKDKYYTIV